MPQSAGWTLWEAVRRTVDPDLLKSCLSARRDWRRAGSPRFVYPFRLDRSENAQRNRYLRALQAAHLSAANAVAEALRAHLVSGLLVARGRRDSPLAEVVSIPAPAWKLLRFKDFKHSIVMEPRPNKTVVYEVRVIPALCSDDVLHRLYDQPLVEVFDRFVFNAPQVAALRKRAVARGGRPRTVGFQSRLHQAYWYIDYGLPPAPASIGGKIDQHDLGQARMADAVLRDRFKRLIQLLLDGTLIAEGAPAGGGEPVEIPRAMWSRKGAVLDLYKGDYFEQYPDLQASEGHILPLYLGLTLRRAAVPPTEMLHVKPIQHDHLLQSTSPAIPPLTQDPSTNSKAVRNAKSRAEARQECSEWLQEEMRKSPSHRPFPKPKWRQEARARWGDLLSYRAFDDAWDQAVTKSGAVAWAAAGAPKRSKQ